MKRASLALLVCVFLFVATPFAATKKSEGDRDRSRDWSDLSLQNGDLPSAGGGVFNGVGNLTLSQGGGPDGPPALNPGIPDNWIGGFGLWSSPGSWSDGVPGINSDVTIYSGLNDTVVLTAGIAFANSVALGGAINGHPSVLTDNGHAQVLTITNGLTINATGSLQLTGGSTVSAGSLVNSDFADIENGSTLQINGNANNNAANLFTDNSGFGGNNTINVTGNLDNTGLIQLFGAGDKATIGGTVTNHLDSDVFLYGAGSMATMGGLANAGVVDVENGSTLQVNGDASNSGNLYTDQLGMGGKNTINITGTLTNTGNFELFGPGDKATLGGLITSAFVDVEHGSTLQINGNASNSADLFTDNSGLGGKNTLNITGNLTNTGIVELFGPGDMATVGGMVTNLLDAEVFVFGAGSMATMGSLANAGVVDVENGSTLQVNGDVNNSGNLYTNQQGIGGKNTVNISGMLTNSGAFELLGAGDKASIGNGVLNNAGGLIDVANGSALNITGNVTNNGNMASTFFNPMDGPGNTLNITGNLTNNGGFGWLGAGDIGGITGNVINNNGFTVLGSDAHTIGGNLTNNADGFLDIDNQSTLHVTGNVTNFGGPFGTAGIYVDAGNFGSTLTIGGSLTNDGVFFVGALALASVGNAVTNNADGLIDVEQGGTLAITGDVTNSGTIQTNLALLGGNNTITITGMLTNSGTFQINGPGDMAMIGGTLANTGDFYVLNGSTATIGNGLTNSLSGFVDVTGGSTLTITGDVTDNGLVELNGSNNKANITGTVTNTYQFVSFGPGSVATMTGLVNSGLADAENGSTFQINGAVDNSGILATNYFNLGGGNTINITGMLTNEAGGQFVLYGPGDMATIGGLTNLNFLVDVEGHSTLQVNGGVSNSGSIATDYYGFGGGNTLGIGGDLTNNGDFFLEGPGDKASIAGNVTNSLNFGLVGSGSMATIGKDLDNSFVVEVENGSTLQVNGNATNSGLLTTTNGGGNTITINGLLTNTAAGTVTLNGPGDVLKALAGISNNGVINVNNGSTIDPPFFNNIGTLNIDGTSRFVVGTPTPMGGQGYIQLHNGTLGEMIAGMNSFGVINVKGSALLDGTLAVLLQGGYNPSVGSTFKFLNFTPGGLSGVFANIQGGIFNGGTEKWFVDYENGGGYVELIAERNGGPVPEPATLLVLIPGLLGAGYGLRRKLVV